MRWWSHEKGTFIKWYRFSEADRRRSVFPVNRRHTDESVFVVYSDSLEHDIPCSALHKNPDKILKVVIWPHCEMGF